MTTATIRTVFVDDVFKAPANFSHARVVDGLVYNSAQIPFDTSGKIVGATFEEQTEKVLQNHASILKEARSSLNRILHINVYLVEPSDYSGFSEVYSRLIPDPKPPRGWVFVKALPAGAKVEMDLVAVVESS